MHLFKEFGASNVEKEVFSRIVAKHPFCWCLWLRLRGALVPPFLYSPFSTPCSSLQFFRWPMYVTLSKTEHLPVSVSLL